MLIWKALLDVIKKGTQSAWFEWEIRNCDGAEKFTFPTIRGFLDYEAKRKGRVEAAKAAKARQSKDRHGREYPRPPFRHGKEYSPTSFVASYRKVPSVSSMQQQSFVRKFSSQSVQQVQTPPMQKVEPPPVLQVQSSVESASASAPIEPTFAFEPASAFELAFASESAFESVNLANRQYASSDLLPLYIGADPLFGRVFHLYSRAPLIYVAIKLSSHFQTLTVMNPEFRIIFRHSFDQKENLPSRLWL